MNLPRCGRGRVSLSTCQSARGEGGDKPKNRLLITPRGRCDPMYAAVYWLSVSGPSSRSCVLNEGGCRRACAYICAATIPAVVTRKGRNVPLIAAYCQAKHRGSCLWHSWRAKEPRPTRRNLHRSSLCRPDDRQVSARQQGLSPHLSHCIRFAPRTRSQPLLAGFVPAAPGVFARPVFLLACGITFRHASSVGGMCSFARGRAGRSAAVHGEP